MPEKIQLYHFGDCGNLDKLNPFYYFQQKGVPQILYLIADSTRFELGVNDIANQLNSNQKEIANVLDMLKNIDMITEKGKRYSINFPVFLEKDLPLIEEFSQKAAFEIGSRILQLKQKLHKKLENLHARNSFAPKRLLYHIIGDYILDGKAIDYFGKKGIFKISKIQPGNRDYILIGFQESEKVSNFSKQLLCSSNNYTIGNFRYNSFGDGNGDRKDLYRFFRQISSGLINATENRDLNLSYLRLIEQYNCKLLEQCSHLINQFLNKSISVSDLSNDEKMGVVFLQEMGYLSQDEYAKIRLQVPVFYNQDLNILADISELIINEIKDDVAQTFRYLPKVCNQLASIEHNVDISEIANELWHQIFGKINEYLVVKGLFSNPRYIINQGRFLQSIYIE